MNIEIANRLVELRKKNGLSQEELAERLGLSRQAVSKWERAESSPDTDNLICLAKLYGISLDELLQTDQTAEEIAEETREQQQQQEEPQVEVVDPEHEGCDCPECHHEMSKPERASIISGGVLVLVGLIAYIIVGFAWGEDGFGWTWGWTLILDGIWISSLVSVIMKRKPSEFAYAILVVSVYCKLGFFGYHYGFPGWGVYWFLFITIPIYHILCVNIERMVDSRNQK